MNSFISILDLCIDEGQVVFELRKQIPDNALLAYENFQSLKQKKSSQQGQCALKLDMSKAYDRVEWNFIEKVMLRLSFNEEQVGLVMNCVRSVEYLVVLNGVKGEKFKPFGGLRQGDPLSPYLFLLCSEGFSLLLKLAKFEGIIKGVKV